MKMLIVLVVVIFGCCCYCVNGDSRFYPSEKDEDYNFPKYPFQQYIQVRKSYSVEHLPSYESSSSQPSHVDKKDSLEKSASNHQHQSSDSTDNHNHQDESSHYYKPPLREEIFIKKKQEVYEERGYSDGHYDHSSHGENGQGHHDHDQSQHHPHHAATSVALSNHHAPKLLKKKPIGSEEGSSTKVLEYIANNEYDKDAHQMGFYKARSHIYCPEVIDFDLSSKSQGMGKGPRPKGKRRLQGLGSKIECLKHKYFGRELLPSAVFMEPAESRQYTIKMGSLSQFVDEMKKNLS